MRTLQATMSRSEVLIECSYPFGKEIPKDERSEPARYGLAFHEGQAILGAGGKFRSQDVVRICRKWSLPARVEDELYTTVPEAYKTLQDWLKSNHFKIDFTKGGTSYVEQPLALIPLVSARPIPPATVADHHYESANPEELPGTADRITDHPKALLIIDHKTGEEDFSRPSGKAQFLSLAIAAARWLLGSVKIREKRRIIVGALHAQRRGLPKVYAEEVAPNVLLAHERALQEGLADIGSGRLRPGPQCDVCPGASICPARGGQLAERGADILRAITVAGGSPMAAVVPANGQGKPLERAQKLGRLYDLAGAAEKMAKQARKDIRREMKETGVMPETSKGYVRLTSHERESLSKESIIGAYGKVKGERLIRQLREDGAINVTTVEQLRAEKERGE